MPKPLQALLAPLLLPPTAAVNSGKGWRLKFGPPTPVIQLSGDLAVAEDAEVGDLVGTLSVANGSGTYTFSITADPDGKFALDGDDLEIDAALDYDAATSHSVTIEADNGVDDPITRMFSIAVTNVSEGTPRLAPTLVLADKTTYPIPLQVMLTDPDIDYGDVYQFQAGPSVTFSSPTIDVEVVLTTGHLDDNDPIDVGLSAIVSPAQTYMRARINGGPWSLIKKHGDTTAPTITSDLSPSTVENTPWSITLTADEEIALWEIVSGPSGATIVDDEFTFDDADFEDATSYSWVIRATDYADNSTTETLELTVTNDAGDDPTAAELVSTTGTGKSQYVTVSGVPKLHLVGAATGAPMMVRATLPAGPTKFQWEMTCTAANGQLLMGIDNGTDNLDSFDLPGNGDTNAVLLRMERPEYGDSDSWHGTSEYEGPYSLATGDTITMRGDKATGVVSWYHTRSGVTNLIGSRTITPYTDWYAIAGTNFTAEFDVKFGTGQAKALDDGYGTYDT